MATQETKEAQGRFESPLPEFPGFIQFPYPLTLPHFKLWWETAVERMDGLNLTDYALFECEWQAAMTLVLEHGRWGIDGVPPGDVKNGQVHLGVAAWVIECAQDYVTPFLPPKQRLVWSTIISQVAARAVSRGR